MNDATKIEEQGMVYWTKPQAKSMAENKGGAPPFSFDNWNTI